MIFIDGVGIGENDPLKNPFIERGFNTFENIFGQIPTLENQSGRKENYFYFPCDARLGVEGLPQSGTGQATIFTGINAPLFIGKHFGPYPYSTTIPLIKEENIFRELKQKGKKVLFANAYPKVFFNYIKSGKSRLSVTSLSCRLSGIRLNTATDVRKGRALTAEITNERWNKKLNYNLRIIKPETAAKRLLRIAEKNDFTLYEFFLTDHLGHGRIKDEFDTVYYNLDMFLLTLLKNITKNLTVLICSDHGNFEDLSTRSHTLNPALTITAGKRAEELAETIKDLTHIKSSIINIL